MVKSLNEQCNIQYLDLCVLGGIEWDECLIVGWKKKNPKKPQMLKGTFQTNGRLWEENTSFVFSIR